MFTRSADLYDAVYSWKDYALEARRVHEAVGARRRSPGRLLLDVACGTGGHLEHLKRWYDCEGCDLDPQMLALAQARHPELRLFQADMARLALGRRYDVIVCLFSSIGYAADLEQAVDEMARHLQPGGVLYVEPWLTPERFEAGRVGAIFVDRDDLKACRMSSVRVDGRVSILDLQYLVGRQGQVEHFSEEHRLQLWTDGEYRAAFLAAGLDVEYDPEGPMGRGAYIGTRPL